MIWCAKEESEREEANSPDKGRRGLVLHKGGLLPGNWRGMAKVTGDGPLKVDSSWAVRSRGFSQVSRLANEA